MNLALHHGGLPFVEPGFGIAHALGQMLLLGGMLVFMLDHALYALFLGTVFIVEKLLVLAAVFQLGAVGAVIAGEGGYFSAVKLHDPVAQAVQKGAVVGNEHQRAVKFPETSFEPFHAAGVQVGGGLVGEEHAAAARERARDAPPGLFTAGEPFAAFQGCKFALQRRVKFVVGQVALLGYDADGRVADDRACIGLQRAGENLDESGLARAVFAHQADALAVVDLEAFYIENGAQRVAFAYINCFQQKFCHKKSLPALSHGSAGVHAQKNRMKKYHAAPMRHTKSAMPVSMARIKCVRRSAANNHQSVVTSEFL